uniref:Homocysteine-responsive endoplasmic reticulum-resident ubiquitin-like domain member 2 protein n=1 Tax=Esox lucius TaxID=8010 RepID=A0AAY5LBK8_ESOLU
MDSGAVDSPVTLVIKAPNQKYDDQTINCFLNWTVEKLKSHISNVYPSKPVSGCWISPSPMRDIVGSLPPFHSHFGGLNKCYFLHRSMCTYMIHLVVCYIM